MQRKCNVTLSCTISKLVEVANASSSLLAKRVSHIFVKYTKYKVTANLEPGHILATNMRLINFKYFISTRYIW